MSVLTDRTQGGSSLMEGEIELMVHRRLTHKGEGGDFIINEPGVDGKGLIIRGKHYLYFQPISSSAQLTKSMAERLFMSPILLFDKYSSITDYSSQRDTTFSALSNSLPESVHLLTLENWRPNQVLIRLEHMYEKSDNSPLSNPVQLNLANLLKNIKILDSVETTLTANQLLSESKRLNWNSVQSSRKKRAIDLTVTLSPQQIRTFILTVEDNTFKDGINPLIGKHLNLIKIFIFIVKCSYNWVKATQNTIPANAYIGGHDINGEPFAICRFQLNADLIAGKANQQLGCVLTYDGKEVYITNNSTFEVLVANDIQWVARHGTDPLPEYALVVGPKPGGLTYVGRCDIRGTQVVGKIDYNFYYGFSGLEWNDCNNHEVLVCV